ncbi:MAG: type II toxin-antitoxin system VapC family toxin [Candidatus Hydrogenedentes bacterium]|nr:type II toxin-antitoxin system VapC family toxin [Candidatus Hydrogenedentota bacterium]
MPMMVDSCVFLDVFSQDARWFGWSSNALAEAADAGTIVLNPVIYSEISMRFDRIEDLEMLLPSSIFEYQPIPREAAFLAGKCFLEYRRRGGRRSLPLPDFFIGAHAAVEHLVLVTRDVTRFREYFPGLQLVHP